MTKSRELFKQERKRFERLQGIALLKRVEEQTNAIFKKDTVFKKDREVLGKENEKKVLRAVLESNFEGIKEFSPGFYKVLKICFKKQKLTRDFIRLAFEKLDHGFSEFDKTLIIGSLEVQDAYDDYYLKWLKTVRNSTAAKKTLNLQKEKPRELKKEVEEKGLNNHYTFILYSDEEGFYQKPYTVYLTKELGRIAKLFRKLANDLTQLQNNKEAQKHIKYLTQYAKCMETKDVDKLEKEWKRLDEVWMEIDYYIQLVHDIEYGYGDPLRTKVIPDFSIRFLDDTYEKENAKIQKYKEVMLDYFAKRNKGAKLTIEGLKTLTNSLAGIYYLPTHTGMSCHFRFSGQSIPNRHEVKSSKGVKIYFDPVSTKMRAERVKELVNKVFMEKNLTQKISAIDSIVNHVSTHELGHAIYGLDAVRKVISIETKSLLEEPRAELTSLSFMLILNEKNLISNDQLEKTLFNFMAHDLRRYADFESSATRPYTISALNTYKVYENTGYLKRTKDGLEVDLSKTKTVLTEFKKQFEKILAAEDNMDGKTLEKELEKMQKETETTKWLVDKLQPVE